MATSLPDRAGLAAAPAAAAGLALPALALSGRVGWLVLAGAAITLVWAWPRLGARGGAVTLLCLAAVLAGAAWSAVRIADLQRSPAGMSAGQHIEALATAHGTVRSGLYGNSVLATVRGQRVDLRTTVAVQTGDLIDVAGRLARPRGPREPGGFDEREWLGRRGVHLVLRASDARIVGRRGGLSGVVDGLRRSALDALARGGGGDPGAIAAGVVLGADATLSVAARDAFRASGLAHLLAVSGANIALLVALVLGLAWAAGLPRAAAHGLAVPSVVAYAAVVGGGAPVVRAAVVGVLASVAWLLNRGSDRWHALALAAVTVQAVEPWAVLEPGPQLTFAAVLAIFVVAPRLEAVLEGRPCPGPLRRPIAMTAACSLATAPVAWWHFGRAALAGSLPANLIALPAAALLLWIGVAAVLVAPLLPAAGAWLAWCAHALGGYLLGAARLGAFIDARGGAIAAVLLAAVGLVAMHRLRGVRALAAVMACAALGALALPLAGGGRDPPQSLRLTFLDVGQGDATLIEAPGLTALVDAGPLTGGVAARLRSLGLRRLDLLVLTHGSADHIGGGGEVVRGLEVGRLLHADAPGSGAGAPAVLADARAHGVPVQVAMAGTVIAAGAVAIRVLSPGRIVPGDPNASAMVLEVSEGSCRALLFADAESPVALQLQLRRATIMRVAHHGSADDGLVRLLARVRPRLAVISVGAGNSYGHPARATVNALMRAGAAIHRTDRDGELTVGCPRTRRRAP